MPRRLVFLLPLLTAACATVTPAPAPEPQTPEAKVIQREPAAEDLRGASFYYLIIGELAGQRGQLTDAGRMYLESARLSRDPRVAERATRIALFARDQKTAGHALALWSELEPEHAERWQADMLLSIRAGRDADAARLIDQHFPAQGETRETAWRQIVSLLAQEGPGAMPAMHALTQRHANEGEAWFALARLALQFKQFDTAESALNKVLRLEPRRKDAWILLAGTYFSTGRIDAGLNQVKAMVEQFPKDQDLRLNYARALIEARRYDEARPLFAELLRKNPEDMDLRYTVALLALDGKDLGTAERELRALLKVPERADAAAYYLGRLEEQRGNERAARDWYERVHEGELRLDAMIRLATLSARHGRMDEARAQLAKARADIEVPEERVRLFLAEAGLLKDADSPEAALKLLDEALIAHPGDPDLLYTRALLADQLDRFPEAEADLRAILAQDPNHPEALNALGFTLAQRNIRLDEALELIDKALKLSPENPAILDSMGWVLFRQGKFGEAEPFLRKAYAREPDGEIAAHLAEVLNALGRRDEAFKLLDDALAREPGRGELLETQKRLRQQP
ncbi:MAG: tetratricopeptide repeat protein [Halothiobacillaceae bacterium]|nr:MAG: tetratricopeptide repeat protein [Halothiobacillaceae bacterium]